MLKLVFLALPLIVATISACTKSNETPAAVRDTPPARDATATPAALTRITDSSEVCMVNDQYMAKPQIPVLVGDRTYYGCCEMCKGRLASDETARTARDPVSGAAVDKAVAVLARTSTGKVLYFENEATLGRYPSMPR